MTVTLRPGDRAGTAPGDEGATYQIRVEGRLGAHWAERLGGMTLDVRNEAGAAPATELTGHLADQAALMGVLAHLYAIGATLLAVRRVEEEAGEPTPPNEQGSRAREDETASVPTHDRREK